MRLIQMFEFLEQSLLSFRSCFRRHAAFRWFVILTIAFIVRDDHLGVTSAIRALMLEHRCYYAVLHFFRSGAWDLQSIRERWYCLVRDSRLPVMIAGRPVLVGDGVKQSKEGKRMPGVKKLHQDSEDSSKGEYIFGHMYGAVGILIGSKTRSLCLPLKINLQDGLQSAASWEGSGISGESHVVQMIRNGYEAAGTMGRSIFLLDRYFLTVSALKVLKGLNTSENGMLLDIISKAKRNCTAYEKPPARKPGKRGRPFKHGAAVKLFPLFNDTSLFQKATVCMYDRKCEVQYLSRTLLWGPGVYQELKFVLVIYDGMKSILASTDTSLEATQIIELYSRRFKIESLFREYKQQIGGFGYHFWAKNLGKLNRFRKKDEADRLSAVTEDKTRQQILAAIRATECFVQLACIAMGIVQMMLLMKKDISDIQQARYVRTKREGQISEATMMRYIRQSFFSWLLLHPKSSITQLILEARPGPDNKKNVA